MRQLNTLLSSVLCMLAISGYAQKQNVIKVNPLGALFGAIGVGFEHALSDHGSVQLDARFFSRGFDVSAVDTSGGIASGKQKFSGFGLSPEYRYYFDQVLDGWYGGAFLNWNTITAKTTYDGGRAIADTKMNITNLGGGIEFGRQWLLGSSDSFAIDLNLGAGFQSASVSGDAGQDGDVIEYNLAGSGIWPKLSFALGYAF